MRTMTPALLLFAAGVISISLLHHVRNSPAAKSAYALKSLGSPPLAY